MVGVPLNLLIFVASVATILTSYSAVGREDHVNYTDTLAGVFGFVLFVSCSLLALSGINSEGTVYTSTGFFWIFLVCGIISALFGIVNGFDSLRSRESHVGNMSIGMDLNDVGRFGR